MNRESVKFIVGLALAQKGIHRFDDVAKRLGISKVYFSLILSCDRTPARYQKAIAEICGRRPVEIFGPFVNPDLIDPPTVGAVARGRSHARTAKESA